MKNMSTKELTLTAVLAAVICLTSAIKLPSLYPGLDFQLSAPFAVLTALCFGIRRYIISGVLANIISFLLGSSNVLAFFISLLFKLGIAIWFKMAGKNAISVFFATFFASGLARLVLSFAINTSVVPLWLAMLPGTVLTSVVILFVYYPVYRGLEVSGMKAFLEPPIPGLSRKRKPAVSIANS